LTKQANNTISKATLVIVSAPSGAGKTTLVNSLQQTMDDLKVSISHTTRDPRPGEINGVDYHFVSTSEFKSIQADNGFLESARVFDHDYGTARSTVNETLNQGIDVILEIDWQGAQQVRDQYQDCISIFILPPSLEILEQRLRRRAQDNEATIARRMQEALSEISHYPAYDYLLLNDDFEQTLDRFKCIITATRQLTRRQTIQQHAVLANLLNQSD